MKAKQKVEVVDTTNTTEVEEVNAALIKVEKKKVPVVNLVFTILTFAGSVLSLLLVTATLFLPFVIIMFGALSLVAWVLFFIIAIIGTLFLILLSEDFKQFNSSWMDFNNNIFQSASTIANQFYIIIPIFVGIGSVSYIACLILTIVGLVRSKKHPVFIVFFALIMTLTVIYAAISTVSLLIHFGQA